jgi:spore coat protein U-like protein
MSYDPKDIITDDEIEIVHGNANFGSMDKREVVNQGVLKCASGFYQGHTSSQIIKDHGLVTDDYQLTVKGKAYLWAAFCYPPERSV